MANLIAEGQHQYPGHARASAQKIPASHRLSRDEEHELAGLIATGDIDARNRLVQANLGLVVTIAREFQGRGRELDDLIGEGNLGLIRAAKDYKSQFGTRFSTYASYWINQSIRYALINTTSTIRLPVHMIRLLAKWRRTEQALAGERVMPPSCEEIASALCLSETQKTLVAKARRALSLRPGMGVALEFRCSATGESRSGDVAIEATVEAHEDRRMLLQHVRRLEKRECTVLKLRYGLEEEVPLTLNQIGTRLGVSRECVRKIEVGALRKLRNDHGDRAIPPKIGISSPAETWGGLHIHGKLLKSSRQASV
jgi:RNA polymerase primary sigma factor